MSAVSAFPPAVENLNPLAAGTRLQEFVIERAIGIGGFGIVYQANDTLLHRTVAIKEYMPTSMASRGDQAAISLRSASYAEDFERGKATFIDEARMLARFKHPALIEVFRFWEQNRTAYMATPFYKGSTLKERLRAKPGVPNEAELKLILLPVLDALEHMHREQVYHRDISPDNIMVVDDGTPILLDLGAARRLEVNQAQAFTVLVKPGFAPIEQYAGDSSNLQGPWTDLYGWGGSAYFALVGKPPPPAASRVMNDSITKLASLKLPGYSRDFLAAIDATLAVRPDDRPQSVAELKLLLAVESPPQSIASATAQTVERDPIAAPSDLPNPPVQDLQDAFVQVFAPSTIVSPPVAAHDLVATNEPINAPDSRSARLQADAESTGATATVVDADSAATEVVAGSGSRFAGLVMIGLIGSLAAYWWFTQPAAKLATGEYALAPVAVELKPDSAPAAPASAETTAANGAESEAPASSSKAVASDKPASVRLAIKPWGEIYVNGESRGVSPPLKALSLPAGEFRVEVRNGDYPAHKMTIKLKPGQVFKINHAFVDAARK